MATMGKGGGNCFRHCRADTVCQAACNGRHFDLYARLSKGRLQASDARYYTGVGFIRPSFFIPLRGYRAEVQSTRKTGGDNRTARK